MSSSVSSLRSPARSITSAPASSALIAFLASFVLNVVAEIFAIFPKNSGLLSLRSFASAPASLILALCSLPVISTFPLLPSILIFPSASLMISGRSCIGRKSANISFSASEKPSTSLGFGAAYFFGLPSLILAETFISSGSSASRIVSSSLYRSSSSEISSLPSGIP